jgi:hypothetical protein
MHDAMCVCRILVSLTKQSVSLVRVISKDLDARYRKLERTVGPEVVKRVYSAIDDFAGGS